MIEIAHQKATKNMWNGAHASSRNNVSNLDRLSSPSKQISSCSSLHKLIYLSSRDSEDITIPFLKSSYLMQGTRILILQRPTNGAVS
jgi:hypothetical protein